MTWLDLSETISYLVHSHTSWSRHYQSECRPYKGRSQCSSNMCNCNYVVEEPYKALAIRLEQRAIRTITTIAQAMFPNQLFNTTSSYPTFVQCLLFSVVISWNISCVQRTPQCCNEHEYSHLFQILCISIFIPF